MEFNYQKNYTLNIGIIFFEKPKKQNPINSVIEKIKKILKKILRGFKISIRITVEKSPKR